MTLAAATLPRTGSAAGRQAGTIQGIFLILPITLSTMGIVVLSPIVPAMAEHFAASPHARLLTQLILTLPALCLALFAAPSGWLADQFGRRRLLLLATGVYSVAGVAPFFLNGLWSILATRVAVGLTEAVIMVCSTTLIGDYFAGSDRDKWLAYQTAIASVAAVVLFAASGALAGALGWRGPFWLYASSLLLLGGLLAFTWEPAPTVNRAHATADPTGFPLAAMSGICSVTVLASVGFFIGQVELSTALVEKHLTDLSTIGVMSAGVSLAVPAGSLLFRFVVSRWALRRQLLLALPTMGAGLILAGLAPTIPLLLAGIALNLFGSGLTLPTLLTWAMRNLSFVQRGRGTGMWMASFEIGQFLSALIATGLASLFGTMRAGFAVVGVVCTLAGVTIALFIGRGLPPLEPPHVGGAERRQHGVRLEPRETIERG